MSNPQSRICKMYVKCGLHAGRGRQNREKAIDKNGYIDKKFDLLIDINIFILFLGAKYVIFTKFPVDKAGEMMYDKDTKSER